MYLKDLHQLKKEDLVGKIICFPTDTVYGVGCILGDETALDKIYELKNRDLSKPLAILVPNKQSIIPFVKECPDIAVNFMDQYWPGALTLIFNKKDGMCDSFTKGLSTIGFRMPASKIALEVLNKFGPLATTSVNISNQPPINSLDEIIKYFGDKIDYIIEDLEEKSNVSSTIVDVSTKEVKVLRQGDIKL
jgi:L-threonylcarbamoyladenylate synthase